MGFVSRSSTDRSNSRLRARALMVPSLVSILLPIDLVNMVGRLLLLPNAAIRSKSEPYSGL